MGPDGGFEFAPTLHVVTLLLFVVAPILYLTSRLTVYVLKQIYLALRWAFRRLYYEFDDELAAKEL